MNINKKNIIVIIPARGGSKGIPKKNIINFLDKPLITHSIQYAKDSNFVDNIYVSTDDKNIAEISLNFFFLISLYPLSKMKGNLFISFL